MARKYPTRRKDPPLKITGTRGFSRGWNTLTHPSTIRNDELAEAQNVLYSQNGVLSKRPGSINIGSARGASTIINALSGVYSIGNPATNYLLRISDDGILQKYSFDSDTWIDIAGSPTFSNVESTILQAYGHAYILNKSDAMVKWDGSSFFTFTALANPTTAPTLAKTGSATGNRSYYYRYVWYNDVGNTIYSDSAHLDNLPDELDASTYVTLTLPAAPAGAKKVGIFRGRLDTEEVFYDEIPATQTTYTDKGTGEEDPLYGIPTSNTTGGFHFKFADVYRNTLIGITTEMGDHTLVFSAGGDKFDSFGRADGGGYYSWRRDDGDPITAVHSFQEKLYVFKHRKIGAFAFDENGGAVTDINLAVGAVSHRSVHAAGNDLRFWSRDGAMSLGNEPNFANIIRTRILSARADKLVQSLTAAEFEKISGVYYKNLSLWGIPTGGADKGITSTIIYDERYVAWSEWLGLTPNIWCIYVNEDNEEKLYYGDAQSGHVVECWSGTHDRGQPIVWRVATKQFDMDKPFQYKTFSTAYFIFGNVAGTETRITLVEDGVRSQVPLALYADQGNQGFGVDQWGTMEFGDTSGEFTGETSGLLVRYLDLGNIDRLSMQAVFQNAGLSDNIELMGVYFAYSESSAPLPGSYQLKRVAN